MTECRWRDFGDEPAEQQPALDSRGLVEALRQYRHNNDSGLVFGYDLETVQRVVAELVEALEHVMYCNEFGFLPDSVQATVSKALATHRKQGGES